MGWRGGGRQPPRDGGWSVSWCVSSGGVYCFSDEQLAEVMRQRDQLQQEGAYEGRPIVTEIKRAATFWPAEASKPADRPLPSSSHAAGGVWVLSVASSGLPPAVPAEGRPDCQEERARQDPVRERPRQPITKR